MPTKYNRVIYRFWHNRSSRGRIGYVGKDTKYPRRARLCLRERKGCPKLYAALMKYPIKFWKIEILVSGYKSNEGLNKAEIFYIQKFNSVADGYNVTKGGDGGPGWCKGCKVSEKTKEKLSQINKGKNHPKWGKKDSFKTRMKKSVAAKGNKGNLGKRFSIKHKRGIAIAQKNAWLGYTKEQREKRCAAMRRGWAKRFNVE
jgi:group I intron endonuclease